MNRRRLAALALLAAWPGAALAEPPGRGERLAVASYNVQFVMPDEDAAKFDLTLYVVEGEQQITLRAVYNPDLFHAVRIEEMLS